MKDSNDNRAVLFKNNHRMSDKSPDYCGRISFEGCEYVLLAWIKQGPKAGEFLSLRVGEALTPEEDAS